jgi:lipid-A-disaccharide synthase
LARAHAPERAGACEVRSDKAAVLAGAAAAIAFPGTITLELARHRVPTLVLALLDPLTYAIGKRVLKDRRLSLPNLLIGEDLFPEWAGTSRGPDLETFRGLLCARDAVGDWDRRLARLAERMGPGDGEVAATQACLDLLGAWASPPVMAVTTEVL